MRKLLPKISVMVSGAMILSRGIPGDFPTDYARGGTRFPSFFLPAACRAAALVRRPTTQQEHVLFGRRRERTAVEAAPARDQCQACPRQQRLDLGGLEQAMDEGDALVRRPAPLDVPDR